MSSMVQMSKDGEFRYIIQWFHEWSELQRDDFVPVLIEYLTQDNGSGNGVAVSDVYMNGLTSTTVLSVELNEKPMSLFQCRIKLFRQWSRKWPADFKYKLQEKINEIDAKVGDKIINTMKTHNGFDSNGNGDSNANGNANETGEAVVAEEPAKGDAGIVAAGASAGITPIESADNQRLIDAAAEVLNTETAAQTAAASDNAVASTMIVVGDADVSSAQSEPAEQVRMQAQENGSVVVVVVTSVDVDAAADDTATAQTVANNIAEISLVD